MPSSINGLILFVVLLTPGCLYLARRESIEATRTPTVLRETAQVVLWSVLSCSLALILFAVVRLALPGETPDVGRLLRDSSRLRATWRSALLAGAATLLVACGIAATAGKPSPAVVKVLVWARGDRVPPIKRWLDATTVPTIRHKSGWDVAFEAPKHTYVHVGAELVDGTYIEGYLYTYNPDEEDNVDRSLILRAPLAIRRHEGLELTELDKHNVVLDAGMIRMLMVTFTTAPAPSPSVASTSQPSTGQAAAPSPGTASAPARCIWP